jgi:hypothetical protein
VRVCIVAVVIALGLPVCALALSADPGGTHVRPAVVARPSADAVTARPEVASPPLADPADLGTSNVNVAVRVGSASANVVVRVSSPSGAGARPPVPTPHGETRVPVPPIGASNGNVTVRVGSPGGTVGHTRPPIPEH